MITLKTIRELAKSFPGSEEGTSYGTPALRVGKKLYLRVHDVEDALVIFLELVEERDSLIARDPKHFYVTDHYENYATVLVRTSISEKAFRPIMEKAWRRVARKKDLEAFDPMR